MAVWEPAAVQYRNAVVKAANGSVIDCEIQHPKFGWIPFSANSGDPDEASRQMHARIAEAGDATPYEAPAPEPTPVPAAISRRQFYTQLFLGGTLTEPQYIAGLQGILPEPLQTIVDSISDPAQRAIAAGMLIAASDFQRGHALVDVFRAANGWTSGQVDQFFIAAAAL